MDFSGIPPGRLFRAAGRPRARPRAARPHPAGLLPFPLMTLPARHVVRTLLAVAATAVAAILLAGAPVRAQSYYTVRLDDPKAVYLDAMGARGDGAADDTAAIQAAIDRVQETVGQGVVFVPEGRYRITKTINVWPSIRLIGYGAKRPVFVLAPNTPGLPGQAARERHGVLRGFAAGSGGRGARPPPPAGARLPTPIPGTFYSAMTQHRHRDRRREPGAVGDPRHLRAALLPRAHGLPHRTRHRRRARHRAT